MLENLKIALTEAIEDEYKARATYRLILNKFGAIRPFVNIVESEERHIQALMPLFSKYGIVLPEDNWQGRVEVPASVQEACQAGVQAEIENAQMYQRLLDLTEGYPDVQRVFLNLQSASQNNHLPAFQRGAERRLSSPFPVSLGGQSDRRRGGGHGQGRGCGHKRGR
ncbi:ferritin-like domain-containing protein [Planktothrix mougeotii]|uniref:DUF2202 domain-containing protein n=1 Tax=Planktothrix mougeotii LEGE 06226 TaxID=1828728 RepID=A0ABR9UA45_9CYAN|nr:DUF2202 domain-containing protein [Planktothrix mougeotii]MBE9143029.1 DUF2202 domain-containing protein [Planktothrix mougeotii LEGE 06226]